MSQLPEDSDTARLTQQKVEVQQQITSLRAEARRIGEMLSQLGRQLEQTPESVGFSDVPGNIKDASSSTVLYKVTQIDGNKIAQLVTYLRVALGRQDRLNQEAKSLGIDLN